MSASGVKKVSNGQVIEREEALNIFKSLNSRAVTREEFDSSTIGYEVYSKDGVESFFKSVDGRLGEGGHDAVLSICKSLNPVDVMHNGTLTRFFVRKLR